MSTETISKCYVCKREFTTGDDVVIVIYGKYGIFQIGQKIVAHVDCVDKELEKVLGKKDVN